MAKAVQLPSGSWRVRVYDKELGKQVSFTSQLEGKAGKAEAELMAREYQLGKRQRAKKGKTVGECIDEYINLKENILSPTTISSYRKDKKNNLSELCGIPLNELTSTDIQAHMNKLSLTKSAKTVRSAHGLLVSVLHVFAPDMRITTTLPKVQKKIKQLPTVQEVMKAVIGSDIELPCLLAMWCSLRMSEVRGARKSDIKDGVLTIQNTIVTADGENIEKQETKTIESTRQIKLPERIISLINALPKEQVYLTTLSGQALYKRFSRLLEAKGVQHMTFHDLRHMNASVMLALGIPDKYAMERGGWSSPHVMKSVYQHTFTAERQAADDKIDDYFNDILDTVLDTNTD
ncbi:site-specific integrase [Ruminococcus sp.]|uniref:site-specific integrase n=1 Tax=Ruminococcus sp. TaxID=41978 RepID=UPI001B51F705|nr:site-specific integrase [Ruminococcus sp.]MBP5431080.1 site-specific integrase [Ruminococcus sp.]